MLKEKILSIQNVHKNYDKKSILSGVNLHIHAGTFYTLLGSNGAGKSTLLRVMSGSEFPDQGEVLFRNISVNAWDVKDKSDLFYVNENIQIDTSLTLRKFTAVFKELFPRWDESYFQLMIKSRQFDLDKNYRICSRGQKMQFNLMFALAARPKVLLLDEITSVMDVYARRYFLQQIHEFTLKGGAVVMTSNIISELQFYTKHLFLIQNNNLVINSPIHEIKQEFVKLKIKPQDDLKILNHHMILWAGTNWDGSDNFLIHQDYTSGYEIQSQYIHPDPITLEDIFVYHSHFNLKRKNEDAA